MSIPSNQAAWLKAANTPLEVGPAPMPTAGAGEIIVKNAAIAINPIDWHQQDAGIFVQQFPAIIGCDVAGKVFKVGAGVERFKKGDRVIGYISPIPSCPIVSQIDQPDVL
jgi:NADPH:quinone reductase-like Zn-dependent oxidoreductase